jgi:hypothetical protein
VTRTEDQNHDDDDNDDDDDDHDDLRRRLQSECTQLSQNSEIFIVVINWKLTSRQNVFSFTSREILVPF